MQFLQTSRDLHRPAIVAEMPADLAHDRGHREGDEVGAGFDVEAGDRVDQSDAGHLNQVVARFPTPLEAPGYVIGQRQAALDDLVSMTLKLRRVGVESGQFTK